MTRRESHRHDFLNRFFVVSTACLLALVFTLDPVYGQDRPAPAAKAAPPGVAEQAKARPAPVILSKAQVVEDLRGRGQPTDAETLGRQGGSKPAPAATGTPPGLDRRPANPPSEPPAFARSKSALFAELEKSQEGRQMLEKARNLRATRGAGASGSGGSMPPNGAAFTIPGVLGFDGAPPVAPRFEYTVDYLSGTNTGASQVVNANTYMWPHYVLLSGANSCLMDRVEVPSTDFYIVNLTIFVMRAGTDVRTYTYPAPDGSAGFGLVSERDVGYPGYAPVPTIQYLSKGSHWFKFCDSGGGRFQPFSLKVYDL